MPKTMRKAAARPDDLLAQIPYFSGLDEATRAGIARALRRRDVAAGEHVVVEGEPCEGLYFVIAGQVRLTKVSAAGLAHILRVLGPGATFNDVAVFDGGPNSDGAVAAGPSTVGFIPKAAMGALVERHPEVARAALKLLSGRQRTLGSLVEDLALRDVTARVAGLILGCIGLHDHHIVEKAGFACARISHQEIADMVGSVREVVQRALKELERDGAIAVERRGLRVLDPAKLERAAQSGEM